MPNGDSDAPGVVDIRMKATDRLRVLSGEMEAPTSARRAGRDLCTSGGSDNAHGGGEQSAKHDGSSAVIVYKPTALQEAAGVEFRQGQNKRAAPIKDAALAHG